MAWVERMSSRISAWRSQMRGVAGVDVLEDVQPVGAVDVDLEHLDAMLLGVANDLGRGVKAHRLAVEEGAGEDVGVVALQPARDVDEKRERGGVAFGEAVFAKALDLLEAALGKLLVVAVLRHALA